MSLPEFLHRRENESIDDYHIRLFDNKDDYEIDKYTIADLLNKEANTSYDESKWRKDYAGYTRWKDYILQKSLDGDRLAEYEEKKIEQEKAKYQNADQKREYRKMVRNSARFDKIKEDIQDAVSKLETKKPLFTSSPPLSTTSGKEGLALWSDWHFGIEVDTTFNKFNKDVFDQRVEKLVSKTIEYGKKNNIDTLHIGQLGDLISGDIHVSTRVQANEDLIEQIKYVSETLAECLNRLSKEFPVVNYYNVIGNHARSGKKSEVGLKENFEYLVPWYLESRLHSVDNVGIVTDRDGYVETSIFDSNIILVHGNFDQADRAVNKLPQLLGYVPDHICGGHVHHNYMKEFGVTSTHVNGSLIGLDDYATQGRFASKPSQKFMVFDEDEGFECEYIIKL